MSGQTLHILIVEDSEDDAVLLLAELQRNGYAPKHQRVDTPEAFVAALKQRPWDAVISDFVLPSFGGPEALFLFREHGSDIPFIAVSGVQGEEAAVGMMRAGAHDYLMKSNLSRLAPALERELEAAESRRLHQRAIGAMQYLAAIVESSGDAIYGKTLESLIVSWNPAAERLFGYSAEEIIGRSVIQLFPSSRRDEMIDILAGIRRGNTVGIRETERLHKNGQVIPVAVTVSPIRDAEGKIIGASSIARDISQQKQAELERQELIERLAAAVKVFRTADDARAPSAVQPASQAPAEARVRRAVFPKLKGNQCAGFGSEGWHVFDTLDEACDYAGEHLAKQGAGEYKVYDARAQLVKSVVYEPPRGGLKIAGQAGDPKPWWKFWK
ncbi:MAG: PAS domain S-box protein [Verrucomicrobiota bacterium]